MKVNHGLSQEFILSFLEEQQFVRCWFSNSELSTSDIEFHPLQLEHPIETNKGLCAV